MKLQSQSFKNGQALANQELENKYGNSPLFNGGPGSGVKGHTTAKDDKKSISSVKRTDTRSYITKRLEEMGKRKEQAETPVQHHIHQVSEKELQKALEKANQGGEGTLKDYIEERIIILDNYIKHTNTPASHFVYQQAKKELQTIQQMNG